MALVMSAQFTFRCADTSDTQALAAAIGAAVRGGEVFEFISDLGGGKTTFTKGLAKGMGVKSVVQSPTFIISSLHKAERGLELHHFDFYRLTDQGVIRAELAESLNQPNAVTVIEWGDIMHDVLPKDRATITITTPVKETRVIAVQLPKVYEHIRAALAKYQEQKGVA